MRRQICDNFIYDMKKAGEKNPCFLPENYLALLCGSSLTEENPRDVDIFIYAGGDEKCFSETLLCELRSADREARLMYLPAFRFYSLKYNSAGYCYSIHIVSVEKMVSFVREASFPETYTDINVFDVKLYRQTVYRKWIMETEYLIGNPSLRENLIQELAKQKKPLESARQELAARLKNNIGYFQEKAANDRIACNIIAGQIFNNLINYCYLINHAYYGTVKYIKKDLEGFQTEQELCHLTVDILESLNLSSFDEMLNRVKRILNYVK